MGWMSLRSHLKDLFTNKIESAGTDPAGSSSRDRKMSSSSQGSMKSKWLKAFKSLKTPAPSNGSSKDQEKKTGKDGLQLSNMDTSHQFQEYTYKKITPCDICSQVLRGHTRQGLKCRLCKTNVHVDCQEKVPAKCQPKSRLLRRQKSTSEIETRVTPAAPDEEAMSVLAMPRPGSVSPGPTMRAAGKLSSHELKTYSRQNSPRLVVTSPGGPGGYGNVSPLPNEAVRRRKLFGGVKSFSMFGGRSQGRSISLPEKNANQYAAMTRPFGQPLVLGVPSNSNGSVPNRDPRIASPSGEPRPISSKRSS